MDKAASEISEAPPEVTVTVAMGEPAEELVAASRDADMLVVGSRGSGGFAKLLLGSVSSQVVAPRVLPGGGDPRGPLDHGLMAGDEGGTSAGGPAGLGPGPGSAHPAGDVGPGPAVGRVLEDLGGPVVLDEHTRPGIALSR